MEIEQDINHILEVLSSQSPKVALRTIKRLEDRLYKLTIPSPKFYRSIYAFDQRLTRITVPG